MSGKQKTLYFKDGTEAALIRLSDNLEMSQSAVVEMLIISADAKMSKKYPPKESGNANPS